jgi:hypothetical protein
MFRTDTRLLCEGLRDEEVQFAIATFDPSQPWFIAYGAVNAIKKIQYPNSLIVSGMHRFKNLAEKHTIESASAILPSYGTSSTLANIKIAKILKAIYSDGDFKNEVFKCIFVDGQIAYFDPAGVCMDYEKLPYKTYVNLKKH